MPSNGLLSFIIVAKWVLLTWQVRIKYLWIEKKDDYYRKPKPDLIYFSVYLSMKYSE